LIITGNNRAIIKIIFAVVLMKKVTGNLMTSCAHSCETESSDFLVSVRIACGINLDGNGYDIPLSVAYCSWRLASWCAGHKENLLH